MNIDDMITDFMVSFDDECYPPELSQDYDILECLASHDSIDTLLAQKRDAGERVIVKCFDNSEYTLSSTEGDILRGLSHDHMPRYICEYRSDTATCLVREYVDGLPLDRYVSELKPDTRACVGVALQICDILAYLHGLTPPVIHRDVKPQNVIIDSAGKAWLIDFDIARVYTPGAESDTSFIGTRDYAPPEQYGFSQTDARADIYSLGVLLRFMITGSARANGNVKLYPPVARVICKCTAFAPNERFSSVGAVRNALLRANPEWQRCKHIVYGACAAALVGLCAWGGVEWWRYETRDPFAGTPAFILDSETANAAAEYLNAKHNTSFFGGQGQADIGYLRRMLVEVYGYEHDYAYGMPPEDDPWPQEHEECFFPWSYEDGYPASRDLIVYTIVKVLWPDVVVDYSSLKDDNGSYPGVRVAMAFAEKHGILDGANRPDDLTKNDVTYIVANAERYYDGITPA